MSCRQQTICMGIIYLQFVHHTIVCVPIVIFLIALCVVVIWHSSNTKKARLKIWSTIGLLNSELHYVQTCVGLYLCTQVLIEKEKYNIMHDAFVIRYPNFDVCIRFIISILFCIYPVTSKLHQMPLIILSPPFDVIIRPFVSSNYTNNYIKCKGYSSPCLIQVYVFHCAFTNSCDSTSSFDVILLHRCDHTSAIFFHQIVVDTYKNKEEMFAKTPASVINIRLLYPSTSSASPFET